MGIKYLYEIAKIKQELDPDLVQHDIEGIVMMLIGSCKSLGIEVVEDTLPPEPIFVEV